VSRRYRWHIRRSTGLARPYSDLEPNWEPYVTTISDTSQTLQPAVRVLAGLRARVAWGLGLYAVAVTGKVTVSALTKMDDSTAEAIASLLPELSASAVFDRARIDAMLTSDATTLLVARLENQIVGMATLVTFPLPTGQRGHVDDVVVASAARGQGVGRALMDAIIELARTRRLRTLDLSSRPSRAAALRLYESVGFRPRSSVLMRFEPTEASAPSAVQPSVRPRPSNSGPSD
jgi:ribosomal protein S18 acetylase RimI-like enzyme